MLLTSQCVAENARRASWPRAECAWPEYLPDGRLNQRVLAADDDAHVRAALRGRHERAGVFAELDGCGCRGIVVVPGRYVVRAPRLVRNLPDRGRLACVIGERHVHFPEVELLPCGRREARYGELTRNRRRLLDDGRERIADRVAGPGPDVPVVAR